MKYIQENYFLIDNFDKQDKQDIFVVVYKIILRTIIARIDISQMMSEYYGDQSTFIQAVINILHDDYYYSQMEEKFSNITRYVDLKDFIIYISKEHIKFNKVENTIKNILENMSVQMYITG